MLIRLILILTLIPLLEMVILIEVGRRIGTGATIGLIILTGFLGAYLAKVQGFEIIRKVQEQIRRGEFPAGAVLDGVLILLGALLLLTPGILTDIAGLALLFPPSRYLVKRWLRSWFEQRVGPGGFIVYRRDDDIYGMDDEDYRRDEDRHWH